MTRKEASVAERKRSIPVDPECRKLAEHWLAAEPPGALKEAEVRELAQAIQLAAEDWFNYRDGEGDRG